MSVSQAEVDVGVDLLQPTSEESPAEADRYAFLSQRAVEFVRRQGGAAHEDLLVAHVFGNTGTVGLWRPLLREVLGRDDGLTLRGDGYWLLPDVESPTADGALLPEFVAVDVETTGLRPLRQRIIEVALVRYRDGVAVERFESLCNPDRRIPQYISNLTGIKDLDVADAPPFAAIADEVVRFLGEAVIVGHNVGFDISFLNAELKRLGRPSLINERIDAMGLAIRLLPGVRKPSLDRVALDLGLNPRNVHRAGVDAQLAAEVALRLVAIADERGMSLDRIKATAASVERRPKDGVGRGRAVLDRSLLADIPKAPGVYVMRDAYDHVIYIGKAKNLRDRVSSYYSQPLGYTRKMDGLLESMVKIDVEVVGSELEALLLESQLIKRYQPRYNTALRAFEHYPFIRVDIGNPWPRLTLAKARKDDGARYFGPYRNKSAARKTVDLINSIVPLRTCPRSFKNARSYGSPCIQLDLGRCLGPCTGHADRDAYMALVREVVQFLDGRDEVLYERLWRGLEDAAARLDFEKADKLRRELRQVRQVVDDHRRLREAAETHTLLLVLPSPDAQAREVMLVIGGRLWAQYRAQRPGGADALAERLAASWRRFKKVGSQPIDHDSVDEANILNRWLYRNAGHPAILPLDAVAGAEDWCALAVKALSLEDDVLIFDAKPLATEDGLVEELGT